MQVAFFGLNLPGPSRNDSTACARREAQAAVVQELAQQALKDGLEVVICGDFNDYDGVTLDEQHNVPVSRVLAMLQDTDGDGSRELQNVAALLSSDERYSAWVDRNYNGYDDGGVEHVLVDHMLLSNGLFELVHSVRIDHAYDATAISGHWPLVVEMHQAPLAGFSPAPEGADLALPFRIIGFSIGITCVCALVICGTTKREKGKQLRFTEWFGLDYGEFWGVKIPNARPPEVAASAAAPVLPSWPFVEPSGPPPPLLPLSQSHNPLGTVTFGAVEDQV